MNIQTELFRIKPSIKFQEEEDVQKTSHPSSLEQELAECRISEAEWKERYMLLSADFANYKRRMGKEQATWIADAQSRMIMEILAIVDDVDRAMAHPVDVHNDDLRNWLQGFTMIQRSLHAFLKKAGVEEVMYVDFDPHYHEAMMEVESSEHTPGKIVSVLQKGYRIGERVLRPARVSVAK